MNSNTVLIDSHLKLATEIALGEVERLAREILRSNKSLKEFIMCMGHFWFIGASGKVVNIINRKMNPKTWKYEYHLDRPSFKELNDFMNKYNESLKLTEEPMRFTAKGKIITDW